MYSIIVPLDSNRLEQFVSTKRAYDLMPQKKEFVIPTRTIEEVSDFLTENDLLKDVRLIPYQIDNGFNCSRALNLGVSKAKYDRIVITSPEVEPLTDVLAQFEGGKNILAQVDDEDPNGIITPLINKQFRGDSPAMYFLACFNKKDIETINGWDEEFMRGYAYEDNDFGERWKRAGLPFEVREDIKALHQYHPRKETTPGGTNVNFQIFNENTRNGVIKPMNGLKKL